MNKEIRKSVLEKINNGIVQMEKFNGINSEDVQRGGIQQYVPFTYIELKELKKALRG